MAKKYVYSTLTNDQIYPVYGKAPAEGQPAPILRQVFIAGKTNVADKHFLTPRGMMTEVSEDDAKLLLESPGFMLHKENGFITIESRNVADVEAVTNSLEGRDKSAPLVEQDFAAEGQKAPVVNKQGGHK